jgi:hypothetical protein
MKRIWNQWKAQRHRREVLEAIARDSSEVLAARVVIESDPQTLDMLRAALNERHTLVLAFTRIGPWPLDPVTNASSGNAEDTPTGAFVMTEDWS